MRASLMLMVMAALSMVAPTDGQTRRILYDVVQLGDIPGEWGGPPSVWALNDAGHATGTTGINSFLWRRGEGISLGSPYEPVCIEGWGYGINNRDEIVGVTCGEHRAFLWRDGRMIDLQGHDPDFSNGVGPPYAWASDINDRGQVVGCASDASGGNGSVFLWEDGVMRMLGMRCGRATRDRLNNRGQVVGLMLRPDGTPTSYLWEKGRTIDLATVGCNGCFPRDINDRGQIVGWFYSGNVSRGFLWEDGVMRDLGSFEPSVINNRGQMVAESPGMLWEDGVVLKLRDVIPPEWVDAFGSDGPLGLDINARGDIATGRQYVLVRRTVSQ